MSSSCTICLEDIFSLPISKTPCGHCFHTECITKWVMSIKTECPACKTRGITRQSLLPLRVYRGQEDRRSIAEIMEEMTDLEARLRMIDAHEPRVIDEIAERTAVIKEAHKRKEELDKEISQKNAEIFDIKVEYDQLGTKLRKLTERTAAFDEVRRLASFLHIDLTDSHRKLAQKQITSKAGLTDYLRRILTLWVTMAAKAKPQVNRTDLEKSLHALNLEKRTLLTKLHSVTKTVDTKQSAGFEPSNALTMIQRSHRELTERKPVLCRFNSISNDEQNKNLLEKDLQPKDIRSFFKRPSVGKIDQIIDQMSSEEDNEMVEEPPTPLENDIIEID